MKKGCCILGMLLLALVFSGCAEQNIPLDHSFWQQPHQKIAVAKAKETSVGFYPVGGQGLLDVAINEGVNHKLSVYLKHTNLSWFHALPTKIADQLKKQRGWKVRAVSTVNRDPLPNNEIRGKNPAKKDFRIFAKKFSSHRLLLLQMQQYGVQRRYYGFIPISEPTAICDLKGELIDLHNNQILWRYDSVAYGTIKGDWEKSPHHKVLLDALKEARTDAVSQLISNLMQTKG